MKQSSCSLIRKSSQIGLIKKTSVFLLCIIFSFSFLFDLSGYLFSLTPRSYSQLFWQQMCGNFPPSVIFCEASWLPISILILKWISEFDTEMGISCILQFLYVSVWGYVRFRRLRAQPHKTASTPLPTLIAGPGFLCSSSPPPSRSHVTCLGARWRGQGS